MIFLNQFVQSSIHKLEDKENIGFFSERRISNHSLKKSRVGYVDAHTTVPEDIFNNHENCDVAKCDYCRFRGWFLKDDISRFEDHILFPLTDFKNRVVGFQIRSLKKKNFETFLLKNDLTPVLFKSETAIRSIYESSECWVVEGPMDLLSLIEVGVDNSVAIMTNNMSRNQIRWLRRLSDKFYLATDSDEAGILGANNARKRLGEDVCERIKWTQYPECKDMNDLLKVIGPKKLRKFVEGVIE